MSDFLLNLVARAAPDAVPQVRPRLLSLFEPPATAAGAEGSLQNGTSWKSHDGTPAARRERAVQPASAPLESVDDEASAREVQLERAGRAIRPAAETDQYAGVADPDPARPPQRDRQPASTVGIPARGGEDRWKSNEPAAGAPALARTAFAIPRGAVPIVPVARATPPAGRPAIAATDASSPAGKSKATEPPAALRPALAGRDRDEHRDASSRPAPSPTIGDAAARGSIVATLVSAAPRRSDGATPSETAPAPEPRVQITIGRVEIRASTPARHAAARPSTADAPPRLSLDEYLRERAHGARR